MKSYKLPICNHEIIFGLFGPTCVLLFLVAQRNLHVLKNQIQVIVVKYFTTMNLILSIRKDLIGKEVYCDSKISDEGF